MKEQGHMYKLSGIIKFEDHGLEFPNQLHGLGVLDIPKRFLAPARANPKRKEVIK